MTYTCFPDQSPFPLPPGVSTPPTAPELIDNGPQLPPNSIEAADDLDLCTLAGLLDSLPDDEVFVPELEDPATPILPPFKEIFYVDAPIRLAGSWFFIPGASVVQGGSAEARLRTGVEFASLINAAVAVKAETSEPSIYLVGVAAVKLKAETVSAMQTSVRLAASAYAIRPGTAFDGSLGVVFGASIVQA